MFRPLPTPPLSVAMETLATVTLDLAECDLHPLATMRRPKEITPQVTTQMGAVQANPTRTTTSKLKLSKTLAAKRAAVAQVRHLVAITNCRKTTTNLAMVACECQLLAAALPRAATPSNRKRLRTVADKLAAVAPARHLVAITNCRKTTTNLAMVACECHLLAAAPPQVATPNNRKHRRTAADKRAAVAPVRHSVAIINCRKTTTNLATVACECQLLAAAPPQVATPSNRKHRRTAAGKRAAVAPVRHLVATTNCHKTTVAQVLAGCECHLLAAVLPQVVTPNNLKTLVAVATTTARSVLLTTSHRLSSTSAVPATCRTVRAESQWPAMTP